MESKHLKGCMVPRVSVCVTFLFTTRDLVIFMFLDTFRIQKILLFSLFPDTFRIQGILSFPCFWTLSIFKGFGRFPVSGHFNFSKVSGNRKNNQILWENHYCQGILSFFLFIDTFWIQKCLETEKRPKPLKKIISFKGFSCFRGKCTLPTQGVRSVPVRSVLSRRSH